MKAEYKIYKAFFETGLEKMYYNQLKEFTGLSHSSLQNSLNRLTEKEILRYEKTKSNTFYKIEDKKLINLRFSELSIMRFNDLNIGVKVPLRNFLKNIPKNIYTIILFGSASRKEEGKKSDIDILVVSDEKTDLKNNKKEAEITSRYPLSIFRCTIKEFIQNKDDIIIQARKTGFPIYKEQNFYEVILDGYK